MIGPSKCSLLVSRRWNYVFNNKLFSNTTVAYNHYQMSMADSYKKEATGTEKKTNTDPMHNETYTYNSDYRSGIHDVSIQTDFDNRRIPYPVCNHNGLFLYKS
mgnify:CR=1 FL=1